MRKRRDPSRFLMPSWTSIHRAQRTDLAVRRVNAVGRAWKSPAQHSIAYREEQPMLDVILLALGLGFFAVVGSVRVRLRPSLRRVP